MKIRFLLYIQVDYPVKVEYFFYIFGSISANVFPSLIQDNFKMYSKKGFRDRGIDALFIRNVEKYIVIFVVLLVGYGILKFIKNKISKGKVEKKSSYLRRIFGYLMDIFEFNLLVSILEVALLNIFVFSLL
jgi:hypothetical protein